MLIIIVYDIHLVVMQIEIFLTLTVLRRFSVDTTFRHTAKGWTRPH